MTLVGKLTLCLLCVTLACAGAALPFRDSSHGSNGNPTSQVVADPDYLWIYDAENRLTGVSGAAAATFVYDGDGNRVKATFGSTTTIYVGNTYERDNGSTVRKYYYAGGVRIAMRSGGQTYYLLGDHLGGTNVTANGTNGAELGRVLYRPWGETRLSSGSTPTTWRFTGQREDATIGLYFYNARYLDPQLGRFISADSVVQGNAREPGVVLPLVVSYANPRVLAQMNDFQRGVGQAFAAFDPQLLNRYAYARNNPLAYRDDSGHVVWWVVGGIVGGVVGFGAYALTHQDNFNWKEAALWTGGGAVVGATFGAGAQFVAGALGTQTTLTTVVTTAGASASSPGGARIIHWLEQNTNRVQHILASKHAWDRLGNLSGNLVQDYRLIQPFIQQTINSGVGRQIDVTPKGPLLEFMATINGQQVVVRVIQLANNAFEISNAWVKTP